MDTVNKARRSMSSYHTEVVVPEHDAEFKMTMTETVKRKHFKTLVILTVLSVCIIGTVIAKPELYPGRVSVGRTPTEVNLEEKSSKDDASPDDIDGGDWKAVRCVSSTEGTWHPATDNLYGLEEYGEDSRGYLFSDYKTDETWSRQWDINDVDEFLFALTDFSQWLVATKEACLLRGDPLYAPIEMSSIKMEPYHALWYNRGIPEDPWVSLLNHTGTTGDYMVVYGEDSYTGHMENLGQDDRGACVWVRTSARQPTASQAATNLTSAGRASSQHSL